jgi:hypothetical protein
MRGWFDFAIADELHQLAGLSAGPNNGEERGHPGLQALQDRARNHWNHVYLHIICRHTT